MHQRRTEALDLDRFLHFRWCRDEDRPPGKQ
jgi:hypothetical protein